MQDNIGEWRTKKSLGIRRQRSDDGPYHRVNKEGTTNSYDYLREVGILDGNANLKRGVGGLELLEI